MIAEIIIYGTLWWFILLGITICLVGWFVSNDKGWLPAISLIIFIGMWWLFGDFSWSSIGTMMVNDGLYVLAGLIFYIIVGTLWSILKWYILCLKIKKKVDAAVEASHGAKPSYVRINDEQYTYPPSASDHKDTLIMWITWWPFGVVVSLIDDPMKYLIEYIYARMGKVYDKISIKVFGSVD
ncbi:MAG: hypothetical protein WC284_08725 [Candidimonas sp.]